MDHVRVADWLAQFAILRKTIEDKAIANDAKNEDEQVNSADWNVCPDLFFKFIFIILIN